MNYTSQTEPSSCADRASCLREDAERMVTYATAIHELLSNLEDRVLDPVPREVAKPAPGLPIQPSLSQSIASTKSMLSHAEDRLSMIVSRI